jgi:predicted secreted protein
MKFVYLALLVATLAISSTALADEDTPTFNRVSLSEAASRQVDNDLMVVELFAQVEGRDATTPAAEVNRLMDWALAVIGSEQRVKAQTLGYQTNAMYKDGRIRGWRVRQSVRLESEDSQALGDLAGELQERLGIQSVDYRISETRQREVVAELTDQALQRFTKRAKDVAGSLGRKGYRLVRIAINDNLHQPAPIMRAMRAEAAMDSAPMPARFEAGTQRLSVTISGEIELSDD